MPQQPARAVRRDGESFAASTLAASGVVAVVHVDSGGRVVAANGMLAEIVGEQDAAALKGRALGDLLAPGCDPAALSPSVDGAPRRDVELRVVGVDGKSALLRGDGFTLDAGGSRPRACGVFVDHTELEGLRHAMQHSARLEALASLVGGVAHDFNNLLTVLIGNLSLMAEEFRHKPETFSKLKASRDAATRGSDLIKQLLGFAGAEEIETSAIDPSEVIRKVVPLVDSALGKRVRLTTELDSGAGSVEANVAQLESVVVNLAVNARDAISGHGSVTIKSSRHSLDERRAAERGLAPGDYMRIRVADDGVGIPPELLERVFEPFFSTKKERGGTGLGLSMVRSFARRHGGRAAIRSELGKGTVVSLWLPVSQDSTDTGSVQTVSLAGLPAGTEHVVVLAADAGLGATVRQMLEVLGYTVTVCGDPAELSAAASRQTVDVLLVDGVAADSPEGSELVERVRGRHADLKVISVLEPRLAASNAASGSSAAVLEKPFSLAELAMLVRGTLDS